MSGSSLVANACEQSVGMNGSSRLSSAVGDNARMYTPFNHCSLTRSNTTDLELMAAGSKCLIYSASVNTSVCSGCPQPRIIKKLRTASGKYPWSRNDCADTSPLYYSSQCE